MMRRAVLSTFVLLAGLSLAWAAVPRVVAPKFASAAPTATWSPTIKDPNITLSNGNMTAAYTIDGTNALVLGTVAITSGQKVRVEFTFDVESGGYLGLGVANSSEAYNDGSWLGIDTNGIAYRETGEVVYNNATAATFAGYSASNIIDMDVDYSGNTVEWFVNGTSVGSHAIGVSGSLYPAVDFKFNHAQVTLVAPGSFTYAPPTGYTKYGQ